MWSAFVILILVSVVNSEINATVKDEAIKYLQKYGYLDDNTITSSSHNVTPVLEKAIALFQEYYQLPGDGVLNNATLQLMRKPRCGLEDIHNYEFNERLQRWPTPHLTWNFHITGNKDLLETTRAAFALWAAQSSLTFTRRTINPNILISFRNRFHTFADKKFGGVQCTSSMDGPGGVLAHAFPPSSEDNYVAEIHVDNDETWHIYLNENPTDKMYLFYVLVHEIGHSLGLGHSTRNDSVMYAFTPDKPFPVTLSFEDILNIQLLYGVKRNNIPAPAPTTMTTTTTTTTTMLPPVYEDLCDLQYIDAILILDHRIFIAYRDHVWSIGINDRTYDNAIALRDYMVFLPENFKRLTAAYQRPSGEIVLFLNDTIYMVEYPSFQLLPGWPKSITDIRLPANAKINVAINTNKGRTFVIFNDHHVAEIDECTMTAIKFNTIQTIFPGIPPGVTSAFRNIDGHLYFTSKRQFYKFNEFTRTVTKAGRFDLQIIDIECPREGLLRQLQDLLHRLVRASNIFKRKDNLMKEEGENE